ncbi:hypothetical protein NPIL_91111, partial [Nephila pilipes]
TRSDNIPIQACSDRSESSPFVLSVTIKNYVEQLQNKHTTDVSLLDFYLYVDDLIAGEVNVQDALEISCSAKQNMRNAEMVFRKWITNESDLMDRWEQEVFDSRL